MPYTELFTEVNAVQLTAPPASRNDATVNGGWVSMRDYHRAVALLALGSAATGGIVNFKLQQAKDAEGSGAKDITGKLIVATDDADDDTQYAIELRSEELDGVNRFDWIRAVLVASGSAAVLTTAFLIRFQPRYAPVGTTGFGQVIT